MEVSRKADVAEVREFEASTTAKMDALGVRIERIDEGVQTLRLVACEKSTHDSYCKAKLTK